MKEIILTGIEEKLYWCKLNNGLELYLFPNKKVNSYYMTFNTKFGSIDTEFKTGKGKYIKVPHGTAHFLEHLLFNEPNNKTAFEHFDKLGVSANAATSFRSTYYEVSGSKNFKETLVYLLDFVQRPCFTAANVEKEKNIIIEEIKMGKSSPYRELFFGSRELVYQKSNFRYPISGEISDIKKISLEDINMCYEAFYQPSNMFVVITGNFNPYEVKAIVEENQLSKSFSEKKQIYRKEIKEPLKVLKEYGLKEMNVEIPKTIINVKISLASFNLKEYGLFKLNHYLYIIFLLKFGNTSSIKELLLENNMLQDGLNISSSINDGVIVLSITFDSKYPNEVIDIIKKELTNMKITSLDLKRKQRVVLSSYIIQFDDIYAMNDYIQSQLYLYNQLYNNEYDVINSLNIKEANEIAKEINNENMSVYIIKGKEKDL